MWQIIPSKPPVTLKGETLLTCTACQVSWRGKPESPCWVCGTPGGPLPISIWF